MDQSNRYADLSLTEAALIAGGQHILVAYKMKPKSGHGYLEAAAHFAAEDMRIAYPLGLFDRNMTDGRMKTWSGSWPTISA